MDPKWPVVTTNHHCFSNQCKRFRILIRVNDFYTEDGKRLSWLFLSGPSCMISNKNIDSHQVTTSETISYNTECTLQLCGVWEKLKQVLKSFPKQNPPILFSVKHEFNKKLFLVIHVCDQKVLHSAVTYICMKNVNYQPMFKILPLSSPWFWDASPLNG